jgi:hypothetical protein
VKTPESLVPKFNLHPLLSPHAMEAASGVLPPAPKTNPEALDEIAPYPALVLTAPATSKD